MTNHRDTSMSSVVCQSDLHKIWTWNATGPETINACVHELIAKAVSRQPQSLAICAWDGNFTYGKPDELLTRLAHRLVEIGMADKIVPVCFEKSKWTTVAMLAVIKAGGASVMMATSQPTERLRSIVQKVDLVLILSSSTKQDLAAQFTRAPTIVVDDASLSALSLYEEDALPVVSPSSRLYLVFTSGSTGTPKGVITERRPSKLITRSWR